MVAAINSSSTFATARVDRLIGRAFSAGAILFSLESFANFYSQLPLLNINAWVIIGLLWISTITFVSSFWFGSSNYIYLRIHALYVALLPMLWPFMISTPASNSGNFYPWIWWGMSTGWLAAALSFRLRWVILYFVLVNLVTHYLFTTPLGGSHSIQTAILDSLYTTLTNGSVAVIALMLRNAAGRSDIANTERIRAAILQAQAEAQAKERLRLDSLVHDSVLTALISAGNASTAQETEAVSELASVAIKRLKSVDASSEKTQSILCSSLYDSIIAAGLRLDPKLEAKKACQTSFEVSGEVATALTEATMQAIQNSVLHAGSKAKRELLLKSTQGNLKIVVIDDGVGFRSNRLPKGRLGIRLSIHGRMEAIGGRAYINSEPRKGTTVVLEWSQQ